MEKTNQNSSYQKLIIWFPLAIMVGIFLILSCNNEPTRTVDPNVEKYGGILKVNIVNEGPTTFFPQEAIIDNAITIIKLGYESLLRYNEEGSEIEGLLAKSWEVNEAGDQYVFHLNENVNFHDDECFEDGKGREMTSDDVAYCLTQLCIKNKNNRYPNLLSDLIVGGKEISSENKIGETNSYLKGIEIIDDFTIKISLVKPSATFINYLTHFATSIYPKEAVIHYGSRMNLQMVGTGPFMLKANYPDKSVIFVRNNNYWKVDEDKHPLPYLDGVKITYFADPNDIKYAVIDEKLDMIVDPSPALLEKLPINDTTATRGFQLNVKQSTAWDINYFSFLMTDSVLKDIRVRKAFNHAIDRQFIKDSILLGMGEISDYGIIPNNFEEFETDGYNFDPVKAKKLLSEAGYNSNNKFPTLVLHITDSDQSLKMGAEIQKMLYNNLGVVIEVNASNVNLHYEKYDQSILPIAEANWEADYYDPDNFLRLFLSKMTPSNGGLNSSLYNNPKFDEVYYQASEAMDKDKRLQLLKEANKIIHNDAVIIPLYCSFHTYVISSKIKSAPVINNAELRLTNTYFEH